MSRRRFVSKGRIKFVSFFLPSEGSMLTQGGSKGCFFFSRHFQKKCYRKIIKSNVNQRGCQKCSFSVKCVFFSLFLINLFSLCKKKQITFLLTFLCFASGMLEANHFRLCLNVKEGKRQSVNIIFFQNYLICGTPFYIA